MEFNPLIFEGFQKAASSSSGISPTFIQDTIGTTGIYTEDATYPNQLIGKSTQTGTGLLMQLFDGTSSPNFQVDAEGSIYKNNARIFRFDGSTIEVGNVGENTVGVNNVLIGVRAGLNSSASVSSSVLIGPYAGRQLLGSNKVAIGYYAGYSSSSNNQIFIGNAAGQSSGSGQKIGIGRNSAFSSGGGNGLFLGDYAGQYFTSGQHIILDMLDRIDMAGGLTDAPIVATYNADPTLQTLLTNSQFTVSYRKGSGDALLVNDGVSDVMRVGYDGTVYVGDTTNYLETSAQKGVRLYGTTSVWNDMLTDLIGRRLSSTTGKVDYVYDENSIKFQSGGSLTNTNNRVAANKQINHFFKVGVNQEFRPHIHWWQQVTSGTVAPIVFSLRWRIQNNGTLKTTAWTTITANAGTTQDVFDFTGEADGLYNQITNFDPIIVTCNISDILQIQLARTDSESGDIEAMNFDIHGQVDSQGSDEEYAKAV